MLKVGTRIQMHSATDEWMQGDRYGQIIGIDPIYVKLDKSEKVIMVHPANLIPVEKTKEDYLATIEEEKRKEIYASIYDSLDHTRSWKSELDRAQQVLNDLAVDGFEITKKK